MREILLVDSKCSNAFIHQVTNAHSLDFSNIIYSKTLKVPQIKLLIAFKTVHN